MAETDILNPQQGFWPDLGDAPTWNYDYTRKKAANSQQQAARMGAPYTRDVANGGRMFTWSWMNRPRATMDRLERFYEDFKDGYFTVIDYDNDSRHHVGRFADTPSIKQVGHFTYSAQGVTFVERPKARMLVYPSDFTKYGHGINVVDDDLQVRVAAMVGTWATQLIPGGTSTSAPSQVELFNAAAAPGDWAQVQYVGWGFRMVFRLSAGFGKVNIYLGGTLMVSGLDLATGAYDLATAPGVATLVAGVSVTVSAIDVPLDIHRVKVYAVAGGTGAGIIFPRLEYIY